MSVWRALRGDTCIVDEQGNTVAMFRQWEDAQRAVDAVNGVGVNVEVQQLREALAKAEASSHSLFQMYTEIHRLDMKYREEQDVRIALAELEVSVLRKDNA